MGRIIAEAKFYDNPNLTVVMVKCDKPDNAGNRYFLEIVRLWGESLIWVRTWHSDTKFVSCLESFDNCTIY